MFDAAAGVARFLFVVLSLPVGAAEPRPASVVPDPVARVEHPGLVEASGLDQSETVPGRYWAHNDGGHPPLLFAMDADGKVHDRPVRVEGVKNVDWESLAVDGRGNLWIADVGNNANRRRDLAVHRVEEPGEAMPESLPVLQTVRFRYPDQEAFPPAKRNFDCEAVFVRDGKLYFLTKHRSDRDTKLYRLALEDTDGERPLELLQRVREVGQVTGADLHPDGDRLAVLTFSGVWVFDVIEDPSLRLGETPLRFQVPNWTMRQTEGVAWVDGETLLITNEQNDVFRLPVTEEAGFRRVRVATE